MKETLSARANSTLLEENYERWKAEPDSVEESWASFFEGFELGMEWLKPVGKNGSAPPAGDPVHVEGGLDITKRAAVVSMVHAFRTLGHMGAHLDPLQRSAPQPAVLSLEALGFSEADLDEDVSTQFFESGKKMKLEVLIARLREIYCHRIGFEYMYINDREVRKWIQQRIETRIEETAWTDEDRKEALTWLSHAEGFEHFLHRKYVGQKRFSVEGGESLMVSLNLLLEHGGATGVKEIVMGMAHRGRLNVLANFLHKPLIVLLYEFQDNYVPDLVAGDGDVKYHLGFDSVRTTKNGDEVAIHLGANPSHLEAVNGVIEGKARAKQRQSDPENRDKGVQRQSVLPVLIHGDAAFAGQGIVAETLNLSQLPGYRTGGTIHIVVNNQIGFTTMPEDARSSDYCTDVAKMIEAPVFHVNGDDPLAVMFVTKLALDFRQKFKRDVVIDIICYRRHGHNEGDEPAFTQPQTYREIRKHLSTKALFRKILIEEGRLSEDEADSIDAEYRARLDTEVQELEDAQKNGDGDKFHDSSGETQPEYSHDPADTAISSEMVRDIGEKISRVPEGFEVNPKIAKRFLAPRAKVVADGGPYNWAFAEALAFGSLLLEGNAVRLSGQDCRRGTFSQRHAVLYDSRTRERYVPLNHLSDDNGGQKEKLWVFNSLLSEYAVLGFEYGYSTIARDKLILWEAQFGDFGNGAQVVIDQFISSAESKWQRSSHLVMLLPHGYEGQGPEHSSARLERFLQLCAEGNMQVCNLTTPAQYFHALRRQMRREFRKPLVIMTPKSLLNYSECVSREEDFTGDSRFVEIFDDTDMEVKDPSKIERMIFCSGKVYYDLIEYRRAHEIHNTVIFRVEQLYPFHWERIKELVGRYSHSSTNLTKWVWCQEEPLNMGAWSYIGPRLQKLTESHVRYAGRDRASSPATGSKAVHKAEQKRLVEDAFSV